MLGSVNGTIWDGYGDGGVGGWFGDRGRGDRLEKLSNPDSSKPKCLHMSQAE